MENSTDIDTLNKLKIHKTEDRMIKKYTVILLISGSVISSTALATDAKDRVYTVNTVELLSRAITNLPSCIEYCINAVVLKVRWKMGRPKFFWTLNVSHNSPNWLTMTHPELDKTPYTEFNVVFGKFYKQTSELFFKEPVSSIAGVNAAEIGGGRYQHKGWGKHQSVQFSEATVIGHPGSMILPMFDQNGLKPASKPGRKGEPEPCRTHGCLEDQGTNIGIGIRNDGGSSSGLSDEEKAKLGSSYLTRWLRGNGAINDPGLLRIFSYKEIHDYIANSPLGSFFKKLGTSIRLAAKPYGGKIERIFCPSEAAPFIPYYLSGYDAYAWRLGYPIADSNYSLTIANPLSKDKLGTKVKPIVKVADKVIEMPKVYEYWGNVFPRDGTVKTQNSAKMGAIVGYRANHILSDKKGTVGRIYRRPHENTVGVWAKDVPPINTTTPGQTESACHSNIANTGIFQQANATYAFTSWPKYHCDLARGSRIASIPLKTCLTPSVPE